MLGTKSVLIGQLITLRNHNNIEITSEAKGEVSCAKL